MEAELFDTEGELKVMGDWLTGIGEGMAKVSKLNVCGGVAVGEMGRRESEGSMFVFDLSSLEDITAKILSSLTLTFLSSSLQSHSRS